MKKILFTYPIALIVALLNVAYAQTAAQKTTHEAKISVELKTICQKKSTNEKVYVFLRTNDLHTDENLFKDNGGMVVGTQGGIVRGFIDVGQLHTLAQSTTIEGIQAGETRNLLLDNNMQGDTILYNTNTKSVHDGQSTLLYNGVRASYKGQGVLVGIIDTGIDYMNPAFLTANGKTRIYKILDFNKNVQGYIPPMLGRGSVFDSSVINKCIDSIRTGKITIAAGTYSPTRNSPLAPIDDNMHGTGIAGMAAGSAVTVTSAGISTPNAYSGIAPEATLLIADLNPGYFSSDIVDAIAYFFAEADRLQMPCVINVSFGSTLGPRDGSDYYSLVIDDLLNNTSGKAVSFATGNFGNARLHTSYNMPVKTDTSFTWFQKRSSDIYLEMYGDTAKLNKIKYSIGLDTAYNDNGVIKYRYVGNISFKNPAINTNTTDELRLPNGTLMGTISTYVSQHNATTYQITVVVQPNIVRTNQPYWRFITTGLGGTRPFDLFTRDALNAIHVPSGSTLSPNLNRYKNPDDRMSICGGFNLCKNGIAVGAYTNLNEFKNANGQLYSISADMGNLWAGSSHGPSRDGRMKPDITAPGRYIPGARLKTFRVLPAANAYNILVGQNHILFNAGTSFSSPVVTGALALYFQANKNRTYLEAANDLKSTALQDNFTTGTTPFTFPIYPANTPTTETWGAGKLNTSALVRQAELAKGALPVEWLSFKAKKTRDNKSLLEWVTATETNNEGFVVERSADNQTFEGISTLIGSKKDQNGLKNYNFIDKNPIVGVNYYRIRQIDFDAKTSYSQTKSLDFTLQNTVAKREVSIYPNPVSDFASIEFSNWNSDETLSVSVSNMMGEVVYGTVLVANGLKQIDVSTLPQGIYMVNMVSQNDFDTLYSQTIRLIKK